MDASREALERRLLDIHENGTLRGRSLEWLARSTFPAPDGGQPHAKHGALFSERFQAAYMAAPENDSNVLRDLQGTDATSIRRINRF